MITVVSLGKFSLTVASKEAKLVDQKLGIGEEVIIRVKKHWRNNAYNYINMYQELFIRNITWKYSWMSANKTIYKTVKLDIGGKMFNIFKIIKEHKRKNEEHWKKLKEKAELELDELRKDMCSRTCILTGKKCSMECSHFYEGYVGEYRIDLGVDGGITYNDHIYKPRCRAWKS